MSSIQSSDGLRGLGLLRGGLEGSGSCWYTCKGSSTAFGLRKRWVMRVGWGAVAQLGERLVRNEEVSGSIPLSSTKESITCDMGIDASDTFCVVVLCRNPSMSESACFPLPLARPERSASHPARLR